MSKVITYKVGNSDTYGRSVWVYNFVDTESIMSQAELNEQFKCIGRMGKYGIRSRLNPNELHSVLTQLGFRDNITASKELSQLQNRIDYCNKRNGCGSCCSQSRMQSCRLLKFHSLNLDVLNYCIEFFNAPIVPEQ